MGNKSKRRRGQSGRKPSWLLPMPWRGRVQMYTVSVSEKDRGIIKMLLNSKGGDDMPSYRSASKLMDELALDSIPESLGECSTDCKEFQVEDERYRFLKKLFEGKIQLTFALSRFLEVCEDHIKDAKMVDKKPAEAAPDKK